MQLFTPRMTWAIDCTSPLRRVPRPPTASRRLCRSALSSVLRDQLSRQLARAPTDRVCPHGTLPAAVPCSTDQARVEAFEIHRTDALPTAVETSLDACAQSTPRPCIPGLSQMECSTGELHRWPC